MIKEKTSKVVEIRHNFRDYEGSRGHIFVHMIKFENRDFGEYHAQTEECLKFKEGEVATYTIEEKTFRGDVEYKIKPVDKKREEKVGYSRWDPKSEMCTCVRSSSMTASELIIGGKAELKDLEELAGRILAWQLKNCNLNQ